MKLNLLFALTFCIGMAACSKDNNNNTAAAPVADAYVGNYNTTDTVSYTSGGNSFINYYSGSATFSKVSDTRIATTGFPYGNHCSGTQADVTATAMSLITNPNCQSWFFSDFSLVRSGTVLTYTYNYHAPGSPTFAVKGRAVKQ